MTPTRLSLITYNLWNIMRWPEREPALREFFRRFRPDIFCLQELRAETRAALDDALPGYARVADDHPGWTRESNIYWNTAVLEPVAHGVADIAIDSDANRGMFWARLRLTGDGRTLLVGTAHYTFQEHPDELRTGLSPRLKQAQRTVEALNHLAQAGEPVFFLGDLNDPVIPTHVLAQAGYRSCFAQLGLLPPPTWPALPTARTAEWEAITNQTIDWIVANDRARPIAAAVPHFFLEDFSPSDHWPVQAIYELLE
jgi:endonuclease/exonuclease/phosphatase family metal-dependent hydrolase